MTHTPAPPAAPPHPHTHPLLLPTPARLFPWLLDYIAGAEALPPQRALHDLRKISHQLLVSARGWVWVGGRADG